MSYEFADGYKIRNQHGLYFMTFTVVDWVDLFSRKIYRDILIKNMQYCRQHKGLRLGAYVMMSNHLHVIWQSLQTDLSAILRDFKSFGTKEFITIIKQEPESRKDWLFHIFHYHANRTNQNKEFKIWTGDNHPEEITSESFLRSKLNYIHENPVRAEIVKRPEDYIYSSASNYITGKGIVEIDYLF